VFGGGYVGVDVFFVISGYLITQIILQERLAGTFTVQGFYERRARRILPALFFVILACVPFAWAWMLPEQFESFAESVAAVALFVSNILFWRTSGYFDAAVEEKVLLHTWSLAVEEQFYLVFPLLIAAGWKLGVRRLAAVMVVLALLSFALCEWAYGTGRTMTAFYLAPTRAWELLIGSTVAFWSIHRAAPETPTRSSSALGMFGLFLIAGSVLAFDRDTPFPGVYALAPTLGTALVLAFAVSGTVPARLLSAKWMVGVGLISYSAYLWHQPLFAFARIHSLRTPPLSVFLALSIVSLLLAYLTWRFVERPFRDRRRRTRAWIFGASATGTVGLVAVGMVVALADGFPSRWQLPPQVAASLSVGNKHPECFDVEAVHERREGWYCNIGPAAASPDFLVFGDSHALAMMPVFERVAASTGNSGMFVGASGCLPFLQIHALRPDQALRNCHALNERVYRQVQERGIRLVYLVARWSYYTDGGYDHDDFSYVGLVPDAPKTPQTSREAFAVGLQKTVTALASMGVRVVLVNQVPQQQVNPARAYYRAFAQNDPAEVLRRSSVAFDAHVGLQRFVREQFEQHRLPGVTLLTLDEYLCSRAVCSIGTASESFYSDEDHLSVAGGKRVEAGVRLVHTSAWQVGSAVTTTSTGSTDIPSE